MKSASVISYCSCNLVTVYPRPVLGCVKAAAALTGNSLSAETQGKRSHWNLPNSGAGQIMKHY